jgi:hypothetical protein
MTTTMDSPSLYTYPTVEPTMSRPSNAHVNEKMARKKKKLPHGVLRGTAGKKIMGEVCRARRNSLLNSSSIEDNV